MHLARFWIYCLLGLTRKIVLIRHTVIFSVIVSVQSLTLRLSCAHRFVFSPSPWGSITTMSRHYSGLLVPTKVSV